MVLVSRIKLRCANVWLTMQPFVLALQINTNLWDTVMTTLDHYSRQQIYPVKDKIKAAFEKELMANS